MIDSHVHLNRPEFAGQTAEVLQRARAAGVMGFLNVGYDLPTSEESVALSASDPRIWATVGIHPHDALQLADADGRLTPAGESTLASLAELARRPRVVAVGEIGLDFYRDLSPRPAQRSALLAQLALARDLDLPVVLHVRDAWRQTLDLLDEAGVPPRRGVLHAFSGGRPEVAWARDRGFLLGIGGPVTYKGSDLPDLVAEAGPDAILLETDAPWLPPVPWRGRRNEPAYLTATLARTAACLGMEPAEVRARTTASFNRLFGVAAGNE